MTITDDLSGGESILNQTLKAEQLRLPEQLYILLTDPETGGPRFNRQRVERALATAVLWEMLNEKIVEADGNEIVRVSEVKLTEAYFRRSALAAASRVPTTGPRLTMEIASELHPIWCTIGEDMVHEHLLTEEVRTRFGFFHQRVLAEASEARRDGQELSDSLKQAARNLWSSTYDDELVRTHPRLLARLLILDNCGLLQPVIGPEAYYDAAPFMSDLRVHLNEVIRKPEQCSTSSFYSGSDGYSSSNCWFCDSGSDFWVSGGGDHGGGGSDSSFGDDSSSSSSGGDWGGDSGGDSSSGGDCGGCGDCGGGGD